MTPEALRRILAQAAAAGLAPPGPQQTKSRDEALAVILDRIDGCVLGRRLWVAVNGNARIALDVSGRRLLRMSAPQGGAFPAAPGLADRPLSGTDAAHASDSAAILAALCADCRDISIRSAPLPDTALAAGGGIGAERLRGALGLPERSDTGSQGDALSALVGIPSGCILADCTADAGWRVRPGQRIPPADALAAMDACLARPEALAALLDEETALALELAPGIFGWLGWRDGVQVAVIVAETNPDSV
jgi:hypothetical protein